jgi:DNA-binding SARP family transcriptional activator/tetratricopeptide (TPR) repeat protein
MGAQFQLQSLGRLALSGPAGELLPRRRKELALLVAIADRSPRPVRREQLQALFWGERDEERARNSFRQALLQLRRALGDALDAEGDAVRLVPDQVGYDVRAFEEAATARRWDEAIEIWRGDFLVGCEDIGGDDFRAWVDAERERLRKLLAGCFDRCVAEAEHAGDLERMSTVAARWCAEFPVDERSHLRLVEALANRGFASKADSVRSAYIKRLASELDDEASPEWLAATDRLVREAREKEGLAATTPRAAASPSPAAISPPLPAPPAANHRSARSLFGVAIAATAVVLLGVRLATARPGAPAPLAVGEITSALPADSLRGFTTMLTISLARIADLDVVSERRLSEFATDAPPGAKLDSVALSAGAREMLEGILSRQPNGGVRADLRRIELETGKTRNAYVIEAGDLTELSDLITEQVARDLGLAAPAARRAATTSSIIAYRLYEQGLRAYHDHDNPAANRFFAGALAEDSTFAMAALYRGLITPDSADEFLARAARHAERATDRERLLVNTMRARTSDPRTLAWADTLLTRYPSEPDAHLVYAQELRRRNRNWEALPHYRRVVELDSANRRAADLCRACDALRDIIDLYSDADSVAAAEDAARLWLRWEPASEPAWNAYSELLGNHQRYAEAHAAIDSSAKYSRDPLSPMTHTIWWFRTNDFAAIDRLAQDYQRSAKPDARMSGLWTRVISSRTQGRMDDALGAAREYRRYSIALNRGGNPNFGAALLEAVVLLEAGRPRESAALFDSLARMHTPPTAAAAGVHRAWHWTHTATALAAAGDTMQLRRLEDSVRVNGALGQERHQHLHLYVRGLRLAAARKPNEAAAAFREALYDSEGSFVRIYLELGRALIAAGRPAEAIAPLRTALRGPTSATGLYATRSELQELLGLAYERNRQPDSAVAQYRLAADAWRGADRSFAVRRGAVEARLTALSMSPSDSAINARRIRKH